MILEPAGSNPFAKGSIRGHRDLATLLEAYRSGAISGAVRYGCLVAHRP